MSTDTRGIRELAKEFFHNSHVHCLGFPKCDGELPGEQHADKCPAKGIKPPKPIDIMTAFAESIVEQCCETICELCRNANYGKPAYFKRHDFEEPQWWHMRTSPSEKEKDNVLCAAEPIRSRWQRGEGQ